MRVESRSIQNFSSNSISCVHSVESFIEITHETPLLIDHSLACCSKNLNFKLHKSENYELKMNRGVSNQLKAGEYST